MVSVNPIEREILLKLVYYGPGLGGKTTTLQHIHDTTDPDHRGKMVSLATPVDRTLYFDYLPVRLPAIGGYSLKLQLFTVPGQVHFNATRKLVLSNADGVIFVADSQTSRSDANMESFDNLLSNLQEHGRDTDAFPVVFHYNKRDLSQILSVDKLQEDLNSRGAPFLETVALTGENVLEGLELLTKEVLRDLRRRDVLARQDDAEIEIRQSEIAFEKETSGISDKVQAYSETVREPEEDTREETAREQRSGEQVSADKSMSSPRTGTVERPTIPAPFALVEKVDNEKARSINDSEVEEHDGTPAETQVAALSLVSLWPEPKQDRAHDIEKAIVDGRYDEATHFITGELRRVLEDTRAGVPKSSDQTVIALLGLDGRQYLEVMKGAVVPSQELTKEGTLRAYLFLIQAIEAAR